MQDVSLAAGPNDDEESCEEEPSVALMLVVLSQDAIEGFHQQVPLLCGFTEPMHRSHPGQALRSVDCAVQCILSTTAVFLSTAMGPTQMNYTVQ